MSFGQKLLNATSKNYFSTIYFTSISLQFMFGTFFFIFQYYISTNKLLNNRMMYLKNKRKGSTNKLLPTSSIKYIIRLLRSLRLNKFALWFHNTVLELLFHNLIWLSFDHVSWIIVVTLTLLKLRVKASVRT